MSAPSRVTRSYDGSAGASASSQARTVNHAQQARRHIDLLACLVLLAVAAALRFWRLEEYLTFLGDQGRDALQVKQMLTAGALPLVGPPTTLAGLHFSPAYYYVLAIPMGLFWLSPVAGAGMVAVLGVASVGLVYALTRTWFGRAAAVASALVYAVSAIAIVSARTAWNPNLLPFFALLAVWAIFRAHRDSNPRWYLPAAILLAVALHLHYAAVLALPAAAMAWLLELQAGAGRSGHAARGAFFRWSAISVAVFLAILLPLVTLLARSDAATDAVSSGGPEGFAPRALDIYGRILVGKHLASENPVLTTVAAICLLIPLVLRARSLPGSHGVWALTVLAFWVVTGVLGFAATPITLHDHYLAALAPAAYLLFGALIAWLWRVGSDHPRAVGTLGRTGAVMLTCALVLAHIFGSPLLDPPDRDLAHADAVARFMHAHADGQPFHLLVVSDRSYEAAYAFHLSLYGDEPVEPSLPAGQVFVVCEVSNCRPQRAAQSTLLSFTTARIDRQETVDRATVYRLVR